MIRPGKTVFWGKKNLQKEIFLKFQNPEIATIFIKKDAFRASYSKMVLPGEFESPSTPWKGVVLGL